MREDLLSKLAKSNPSKIYRNLAPAKLIEKALERGEGTLGANGALVTNTGERTGRSPNDRFICEDDWSKTKICWGKVNRPIQQEIFDRLLDKALNYLSEKELFVFEGFAGADPEFRLPLQVIAEKAWHALFANTLFIRPTTDELKSHSPEFRIVNAFDLKIDPKEFGINSSTFVGISFERGIILAIGTGYGGEMKKAIFTVMNGLLPERDVFPMHCSANVGRDGNTALFFGLSGTGKTTLSADPDRMLIGDDEHGWSSRGIFNFEGGCYAKVIKLSHEAEPQIFDAIKFGSLLENVVMDPSSRAIDYSDGTITENTRATYPVEHIPNCVIPGIGNHPKQIFFLTCDAFGCLPPIAKLTPEMAMYHFLSGYTAKLAGTEVGINEPEATFSTCFGAPFMPLDPAIYAKLLGERMEQHKASCWLVNSGWSGGPYGVGKRMKIGITRALLSAAFSGKLADVEFELDPIFNLLVPKSCEGVPAECLSPRNTWGDRSAYDAKAHELAKRFQTNFEKYRASAGEKIAAAGPKG